MKRTALARGPVRLSRRTGLTRAALARPNSRVSVPTQGTAARAPHAAQERRTPQGWTEETREAVSSRSRNCEIGTCTELATDMHHRQRRREGNHTPANALHLCRAHHSWVHAHPAQARASGWIVSFAADPAVEPAVVRGRLVWLTDDGRYVDAGQVAS